jgi:hypothetical protein
VHLARVSGGASDRKGRFPDSRSWFVVHGWREPTTGLRLEQNMSDTAESTKHYDKVKDPKDVTIIVNTRKHDVPKNEEVSFEAVVALAYPTAPAGENVEFTVMYQRGEGNKDGTLVPGQSVKVKDGMIFDVTPTDKS